MSMKNSEDKEKSVISKAFDRILKYKEKVEDFVNIVNIWNGYYEERKEDAETRKPEDETSYEKMNNDLTSQEEAILRATSDTAADLGYESIKDNVFTDVTDFLEQYVDKLVEGMPEGVLKDQIKEDLMQPK